MYKIVEEFMKIDGWDDIVNTHSDRVIQIEKEINLISNDSEKSIYPKSEHVFSALNKTSLNEVSVVILGQDPYHKSELVDGEKVPQAMGLSFSAPRGVKIPRSLNNIYKELERTIPNFKKPEHGDLSKWSDRVLMLNSVLTVNDSEPNSHKKVGWEHITKDILNLLSNRNKPIVFLSWGRFAHDLTKEFEDTHHLVIKTSHPSPLGARKASKTGEFDAFLGSDCFLKANEFLKKNNIKEVDWNLE